MIALNVHYVISLKRVLICLTPLGIAPLPQHVPQHENGDLRKIKVCVNLRKVGHPTLRKLSTARKGL